MSNQKSKQTLVTVQPIEIKIPQLSQKRSRVNLEQKSTKITAPKGQLRIEPEKVKPKYTIKPVQKFPISKEELKQRIERKKNIRQFVNYYNFLKRSGQKTQVVFPIKKPKSVKHEVISQPTITPPRIVPQPKFKLQPVKKIPMKFRRPTIPPLEETRIRALSTFRPAIVEPPYIEAPVIKTPTKVMPEEEIIEERIPEREVPIVNREVVQREVIPIPEYHEKSLIEEVRPIPEYHTTEIVKEVQPIPEYHEYVETVQAIPEYHFEEVRPVVVKDRIPYPVFTPVKRPVNSIEKALVVDNKMVPRIVDTSYNYKDEGEVTVISPTSRLVIKSKPTQPQSISSVNILPLYANVPEQIRELFIYTPEMTRLRNLLSKCKF